MMIKKLISGGQTGADQAVIDVGLELGISHGGWVPDGRETGVNGVPDKTGSDGTRSLAYSERIELNVIESDGTLLVSHGKLTGGSALIKRLSEQHMKPYLHIDLDVLDYAKGAEIISSWIESRGISHLNVAGPRASKDPKIYQATKTILKSVILNCMPNIDK